jgi:dTDP-4-amino-4,6-dideoxygalactose transaminase
MLTLIPTEHWDYSAADVIRGLLTAAASRHSYRESHISLPGVGDCQPVRSGRAAIVLALKALGLPAGASIGVPLYCCPVVFKAIQAAGFVPRFLDVDPATYCVSADDLASKCSEVDAVIAVHMFGNVCDVPALRKAAPDKPIVEDCAQSLGSGLNDRLTGCFGDIAVFSFRSGKYLSVGEGAAIFCNNTTLESPLSDLFTALAVPSRLEESIHVAKTYLRTLLRTRPLWGVIGSRLWAAYNATTSYTSMSPLVVGRIYQTDRAATLRRLSGLRDWIEKQRSYARYYDQNLSVPLEMLCSEPLTAFYNRLQYPLLMPTSEHCSQMSDLLEQDLISTARPYKDIAEVATTYYGYAGDCPRAERIARTVLVIPCNHGLEIRDVERIANCINRAWSATQRSVGPALVTAVANFS